MLPEEFSPVTRRIWSSPDTILFLSVGVWFEFTISRAVDWLFFTNVVPKIPIERYLNTVLFAQRIFLSDPVRAAAAIATVNRIHGRVEEARGSAIPQWAYRDVLFSLIDYGERAHAIVFGPMSAAERAGYFEEVIAVGKAMNISGLPTSYGEYRARRRQQLLEDFVHGPLTDELNSSLREALGILRFRLWRTVQASMVPPELAPIVGLQPNRLVDGLLRYYRHLPGGGDKLHRLHHVLLPRRFAGRLRELASS